MDDVNYKVALAEDYHYKALGIFDEEWSVSGQVIPRIGETISLENIDADRGKIHLFGRVDNIIHPYFIMPDENNISAEPMVYITPESLI
jgi:hypothetical protein